MAAVDAGRDASSVRLPGLKTASRTGVRGGKNQAAYANPPPRDGATERPCNAVFSPRICALSLCREDAHARIRDYLGGRRGVGPGRVFEPAQERYAELRLERRQVGLGSFEGGVHCV